MNNRMMEYLDRMAAKERAAVELRELSVRPHLLPLEARAGAEGIPVPYGMIESLRRSARREEWPWYFHGSGGRGLAGAVFRSWSGSAQWLSMVDFCECHRQTGLWRAVGLLVIDQLTAVGVEGGRSLRDLIRDRKGRPLIFTGTLSLDGLSVFGGEFQSWIAAGNVVDISRRDLRTPNCERGMPVD